MYIASDADAFAVHLAEDATAEGTATFAVVEAAVEGANFTARLIESGFGHGGAAVFTAYAGHEARAGAAGFMHQRLG